MPGRKKMYSIKADITSQLLECIEDERDIPYDLEHAASTYGINIEQLKEIIKDVNEKEPKFINSESSETGVPYSEDDYFNYPEAYT
jgi:hypothetical protein